MQTNTFSGYAAIIGRPNVGKSTLLNKMLGQKISITSKKPQTTRHAILGIKTIADRQVIFVDTPGLHSDAKHVINKMMVKAALRSIRDVDVVVFMVQALKWETEDDFILKKLAKSRRQVVLAINKIDQVKDKTLLLPYIEKVQAKVKECKLELLSIIPLSAKQGLSVANLEDMIFAKMPVGPFLFPAGQITDRNEKFLASELIREKLMRLLGQELPHALTVEIEQFEPVDSTLHIGAIIWVERSGQKNIVIGKDGVKLKEVGTLARTEMERLFNEKIYLRLWVKVKKGWKDDAKTLGRFGYD